MKRLIQIVLVFLAIAALVVGLLVVWLLVDTRRDLSTARQACQAAVTKHAKYESGVKFINGTEDESESSSRGTGVNYFVDGEVDLINGFGAPIRHTYWCHVGANRGETGRPEVTIEQKHK